ncbi:MAG: nucleoside triphosphate pyrophosphohydrolase family protein [Methylococcales bacterium]
MNEHLKAVRAFHAALNYPQVALEKQSRLSDMEVIKYQALLMEAGSETLKALEAGEMAEILLGLVDLAYVALAAIATEGGEVTDKAVYWQHDGYVLSVMKGLTDKINDCSSGSADNYSELYCLCIHLARGFVNADFNKAFQVVHQNNLSRLSINCESFYSDTGNLRKLKLKHAPDLNECLFE